MSTKNTKDKTHRHSQRENFGVPPDRLGFSPPQIPTVTNVTSTPDAAIATLNHLSMTEDSASNQRELQNDLQVLLSQLQEERNKSKRLENEVREMRDKINETKEKPSSQSHADNEYEDSIENEPEQESVEGNIRVQDEMCFSPQFNHHDQRNITFESNLAATFANAMVQALQFQSQRTEELLQQQLRNSERLFARQSQGSYLPTFSGNPLEWPLFYQHYVQSTKDCGFTLAQNMTRLEKALRGEARKTVRALMIVPNNADLVIKTLQQRYGRPDFVIQALMDIARKTSSPKENNLLTLIDFSTAVTNLVLTVKALNEPSFLENPVLLQELIDKLPETLKLMWGIKALELNTRPNLDNFANWVNQMSQAAGMVTIPKIRFKERREEDIFFTTHDEGISRFSEIENTKTSKQVACQYCSTDGHIMGTCPEFKLLATNQRWDYVKKQKHCFRCLRKNHIVSQCKSKIVCRINGCSRKHNPLLHDNTSSPKQLQSNKQEHQENNNQVEELNGSLDIWSGSSILKIVVVEIHGPKGSMVVNALMDDGSTTTLLSRQVADSLGLDGPVDPLHIRWTNAMSQQDLSSKRVDIWINEPGKRERFQLKNVRTVQALKLPSQRHDLEDIISRYEHLALKKIKFLPGQRPLILIGEPHAHLTVGRQVIEVDEISPLLTETRLGWVIHGPLDASGKEEMAFMCHESDDEKLHDLVRESFSLENIGIKNICSLRSKEDATAEAIVEKITCRVVDRWQTGLLWKSKQPSLPPSREIALRRLKYVEKKIGRDENLAKQYHEKIQHYLDVGYARRLSTEELTENSNIEWYLPHFYTVHPNKPGKIRIVFDAKSSSQGVSLNDNLLTGPDLLQSLPGILLKFRQKRVAISGDIAEMFHQVLVRPEDQPAQRFLWREKQSDEPSVFQLNVLMFGSVCSPFCAQYVKNRNALELENKYPSAVKAIISKHYMDDYLDSMDSEAEAIKLAKEVTLVHKAGGFEIGKWSSNSDYVKNQLTGNKEFNDIKSFSEWSEIPTVRALGLYWLPQLDVLAFRVNLDRAGVGVATGEIIPTKRIVLRTMMLLWDPLGFLGHYTIKARILLQDIWRAKIGWDDKITETQFKKWKKWIRVLPCLNEIKIPRCYSISASLSDNVTLHVFADSSELASCAVAYLRVKDFTEIKLAMVMSKIRVAPLKPCSIPKLELTAALIASRMGKFILSELDIKIHGVTYWTDCMTVLRWIRSDARRYQQFVANRIGEIQENSEVRQWRWVPTADNPADDGTRDGKVDISNTSRFLFGPSFLHLPEEKYPDEPESKQIISSDAEYMRKEFVAILIEAPEICVPKVDRFSYYNKLVRCTARVLSLANKTSFLIPKNCH